jgi:hypothetical protein
MRMARNTDPLRIASARITGTVKACIVAHRLTQDQALVHIGSALGSVSELRWGEVLSDAAAGYVDSDESWREPALALLVRAGADLDRARAIKAARGSNRLAR